MTREPINTKGHYSTWLWHWVCDRVGCKSVDPVLVSKNQLPEPEEMQRRGWFIAKVWGDRCPPCVNSGQVDDVEPWKPRPPARPVETLLPVPTSIKALSRALQPAPEPAVGEPLPDEVSALLASRYELIHGTDGPQGGVVLSSADERFMGWLDALVQQGVDGASALRQALYTHGRIEIWLPGGED